MKYAALLLAVALSTPAFAEKVIIPQQGGGECLNQEAFDAVDKEFTRLQLQVIDLKAENLNLKQRTEGMAATSELNVKILGWTVGISVLLGVGIGLLIPHLKK